MTHPRPNERWILRKTRPVSYFECWTAIGPKMTDKRSEAYKFPSEREAIGASARHWALLVYEPFQLRERSRNGRRRR